MLPCLYFLKSLALGNSYLDTPIECSLFARYFWDQALVINMALQQAQNEFIERYQKFVKEGKRKDCFPLICSECPGWVCYAEKVAGEEAIPYMSKVKSPQQIMGKIVKELIPRVLQAVV